MGLSFDRNAFRPNGRQNLKLLAGASTLTLAIVCSFPSEVLAETYLVANETELRDAITAANADGDASATIVLTGSFAVSAPNLPSPTKPMTIDTQGFTLAGAATNGAISFTDTGGNTVTISGTLAGAGGSGAAGGGIGLWTRSSLVASSVVNEALITGGAGGAGGGAGGTGTRILSTTFVNEGTVRGGEGGGGGNGGAGLQLSRNSTATNNGLIEGGTGAAGGAGTATGGAGVEFSVPIGASTLINNGVIRGGSGAASGLFASGVIVRSTGNSIVNSGTIEGGLGGAGIAATNGTLNLDIVNSGTIRAGDGQTDAINRLAAATTGTLTLELQAGSVIEGNVVAGATPTADILRLGGTGSDTFDVSEIGAAAQYQNFDVFQKTGAGTWALTGTGTATTDWDIQAGTLQLGDGGTSGSIVGNVVNNGVFAFNRSDDFVYGGFISGSGSVGQIGSGTTTLTGTNTYEGGTFISAGTLSIDRDANLGTASGALVLANGALSTRADMTSSRSIGLTGFGAFLVDPATTLTLDGVISGTGSLAKGSAGTLVLSGTNTYEGGTSISGGTLQVSSDVNLGDAAGGLTFDSGTLNATASLISGRNVRLLGTGRLLTDAGTTFTLGGVISGGGTLYKEGAGTLVLAGDSDNYTGGTIISDGMLQMGAGGTSGSISGPVLNNAALAFNRSDVLTVSGLIAGSGSVSQIGPGTTILTGDNSYSGATNVRAGTLRINGDQSLAIGLTTVASGARLGGSGTIGGDVAVSAGAIVAPGNSIGTLTVAGDYTGSGGTVDVETELGDDASATDRLVIGGDTSGASNVRVTNVGGGGGQTIEGIKIIDVAGASNGSFSLIGDYLFEGEQAVVGGAYAYRLYQNGISTPADGDWYLRSELIEAPGDPDPTPLYAPGVPIYEAYAGALQSFNELGTLRQRTGGRPPANDQDAAGSDGGSGQAIRTRIEAAHGHFEPGTSTTGTAYDVDTWKLEAGLDGLLHEGDAGLLIGGISLHYGTVSAEVSSVFGDGDIDATGYGFGASLTWYGNSGFYVDTQGALTWYDTNLHSSTLGATLVNGNDGFGYALGIEAGQTIDLSGNWSLTPQAQLAYSSVRFDDFTDPYGAAVSLGDGDTLIGRLGISANYAEEWKDEAGKRSASSVYSIANLYYDFLDGSDVDISGTRVIGGNRSLWGGLGIGGSYSWSNGRYSVHGEAFARTSLQDFGDSNSFGGKIGFSVKW